MIVLKFMFDECIAAPIMRTLFANLPEGCYFEHVTDRFRSGTEDEEWLSQLENEGSWIVIAADRAKHSPRGKKLPEICRARKITHVMLSSTLHEKPSRIKAAALALKWDDIALLHQKPQGTRALCEIVRPKKRAMRSTCKSSNSQISDVANQERQGPALNRTGLHRLAFKLGY